MCKILVMAGLNPKNKKLNWDFIATMGDIMSKGNDDGLGYTAVDTKGNLFGERWLVNHEAFDTRITHTKPRKIDKSKLAKIKQMVSGDFVEMEEEMEIPAIEKYGTFGDLTDEIMAVTLHTRAATGTVCYKNVHPFVDEGKSVSVIHNGVIRNHTLSDEIRSTCDSERILNMYLDNNMGANPEKLQDFIDSIKGWFACGIFSLDKDGKRVLDVFKTRANLGAAYVKELDTVVFSTDIDDVRKACRALDMTIISKAKSVKEDTFMRLDAMTGKSLMTTKYKDTTWNSTNTYPSYNNRSYMGDYDKDYDNWQAEAEERRKRVAETSRNNGNVISLNQGNAQTTSSETVVEERKTETQQQEEAELRKTGLTEEEIKMNTTKKEIETAKEIVAKNTNDPLNENTAALDGYHMNRESGLWIKRSSKLN